MLAKRPTATTIRLQPGEQRLIKDLLKRYRDSLDILAEPRHNEMVRKSNDLLKRLP